jgi:hypothetical protein
MLMTLLVVQLVIDEHFSHCRELEDARSMPFVPHATPAVGTPSILAGNLRAPADEMVYSELPDTSQVTSEEVDGTSSPPFTGKVGNGALCATAASAK